MQVSGPLAGGGAGTSPPRSPGHPPSWGFPTSRLPVAHFLWVESIWDTKAGNVGCHSHARPSRIKTQLCAGQQVCKLLPPQKFGVALSELYCGVCVIFFWINPSLENSQIGLSRDRVTSVPGTVTRGLGAEDTESTWMSGALTFWKNDLGKQSSPGFPFPFQDAESPAETLPGSGCSLAGLGCAVPGMCGATLQGTAFPETPHSAAIPGGMGQGQRVAEPDVPLSDPGANPARWGHKPG